MITPKITNLGYSNLWTDMSTILGYASNFDQQIKKIFSTGEQGFAYDPNDLTTLYQDAVGTVPVTATGQPVGLMIDKSGRGNNAYQTVATSRPILRRNVTTGKYYLAFDGFDDFLVTKNIDFTATGSMSLFLGASRLSNASVGVIAELSGNANNTTGAFYVISPSSAGTSTVGYLTKGTLAYAASCVNNSTFLTTLRSNITDKKYEFRVDGKLLLSSSPNLGVGKFGNHPLYIGRRGGVSLTFNGHLYSLIGIGRLTSESETITLEKFIAKNTGVTLSV